VPGAGKSGLDLTTNFTGTVLDEFNNGRHGSKVSVSFVDGHAESMLPRKPAYDYHIDTAAAAEDNMFRAR
jgi:prepilin-type processing-associated H-X9-DG protein